MIQVFQSGSEDVIEEHAQWVSETNFNKILDVGGAIKPLRCATHIMDILPFGFQPAGGRGPLPERFDSSSWIAQDICEPWPFEDDYFDYVWCSQTVEDIRDPVFACREMIRVGKQGFVSTVHRSYESGQISNDGLVGYCHHRWLVEIKGDEVIFTFKSPLLYVNPEVRPPIRQQFLHFVWSDSFRVRENFIMYYEDSQLKDLLAYKEGLKK